MVSNTLAIDTQRNTYYNVVNEESAENDKGFKPFKLFEKRILN
jgi:hypothetical protein